MYKIQINVKTPADSREKMFKIGFMRLSWDLIEKSKYKLNHTITVLAKQEEIYQKFWIDLEITGYLWNKLFKRELREKIYMEESMRLFEDTLAVAAILTALKTVAVLK